MPLPNPIAGTDGPPKFSMRVSYRPPPSTVPCEHKLEHRFGIVIQPAHELGIDLILDAAGIEDGTQFFKVLAALVAQIIDGTGRALVDLCARLFLAVEDAQRILFEAGVAGPAHFGQVRAQVLFERLVELGAAVLAADGVDVELHPLYPEGGDIVAREEDDLRVRFGSLSAEDLDAELVMLAQSARLRPLIAENGCDIIHL